MKMKTLLSRAGLAAAFVGLTAVPLSVEPAVAAPTATSRVLVARAYDGVGYTGAVWDIYAAHGCTASTSDSEWFLQELGSWNDRISSIKTYNHCDVKLYQFTSWKGEASGWINNNSDLRSYGGGWSNRASSLKFS